jgi:hypothetical protein
LTDSDNSVITVNAAADAVNDSGTTPEDTAITLSVLGNDSFANANKLITAVNGTAITAGGASVAVTGGTVALNMSSQLVYTPTANYNGAPSFTYTVQTLTAGALDYRFQDGVPAANQVGNISNTGGVVGVATDFDVTALTRLA